MDVVIIVITVLCFNISLCLSQSNDDDNSILSDDGQTSALESFSLGESLENENEIGDVEEVDSEDESGVILPVTVVTLPTSEPLTCLETFEEFNGVCYFFQAADRPKNSILWPAAREECQNMRPGVDLVSIETEAEFNFITGRLMALYGTPVGVNFWTGAMWDTDSNMAIWVATGQPTNLPNNVETNPVTGTDNCGRIFYSTSSTYSHRGLTCELLDSALTGYICEQDLSVATTTLAPIVCPANFELINRRCYNFNEATRAKRDFLWPAARTECQNLAAGADLVEIESVNEFNLITARLQELYPTPGNRNFWTGAMFVGGQAIWVATNNPVNLPGSIQTLGITSSNPCGRIFYSSTFVYTHRGISCTTLSNVRFGYVCEIF